jgi:hypothetical protein
MIPDIGLIVAVYVVFRCIESLAHLTKGGSGSELHIGAQWLIALCGIAAIATAFICGAHLYNAGTSGMTSGGAPPGAGVLPVP